VRERERGEEEKKGVEMVNLLLLFRRNFALYDNNNNKQQELLVQLTAKCNPYDFCSLSS